MQKQPDDFYVECYPRSSGVTGNCNFFSAHFPNGEVFRFLDDCGMFQGNEDSSKNQMIPFDVHEIDCVFITHNHIDHMGLLPLLVQQGYRNPIFTSYPTARLIDVALYDSCKIEDKELGVPLYDEDDVEQTLNLVVGCVYKKILKPHKHVHAIMFNNGHLVGASVIFVTISYPGRNPINLLFTGDYRNNNCFFDVQTIPKRVCESKFSAIFTESTYGDVESTSIRFKPVFENNIKEAVKSGKTIILPAFSQGRYQEILLNLKKLQDKGELPVKIPIWIDGYTGQEYTRRYLYSDLGLNKIKGTIMPQNVHFIPNKHRKIARDSLIRDLSPRIFIAPGGMGNYGSIQKYISSYLPREDALIHYLGYCSPESRASELINADYGSVVNYAGKSYIKRCEVKQTGEFSGHAKRNELLRFLKQFPHKNAVLITHGEEEVRKKFKSYLRDNLDESTQIGILYPGYGYKITSNEVTTFEIPLSK